MRWSFKVTILFTQNYSPLGGNWGWAKWSILCNRFHISWFTVDKYIDEKTFVNFFYKMIE
jgi:hypothetical protein